MRLRSLVIPILVVACCLLVVPVLHADSGSCADCYGPNESDPDGISTPYAHCYWSSQGMFGSCVSGYDTMAKCSSTSTATYCPNKTSGGGAGGGGGTGTGGSSCSTRRTGQCPPDCISCGGQLF
jgi:hypothetical protein